PCVARGQSPLATAALVGPASRPSSPSPAPPPRRAGSAGRCWWSPPGSGCGWGCGCWGAGRWAWSGARPWGGRWRVECALVDVGTVGVVFWLLGRDGRAYRRLLGPPTGVWQVALGAVGV